MQPRTEEQLRIKLKNPIFQLVGNTPLVRISDRVYGKLETYNPTGSVKDRMISYILTDALLSDEINSNTHLVEATSGNTGISLSAFGAALGMRVTIIMPCNMSEERKSMMRTYGAEIIEVGPSDFQGAIALREQMVKEDPDAWSPRQFENDLNVECHERTTGPEIRNDVTAIRAKWDAFVSGAGTGGTMMGIQRFLGGRHRGVDCVLTVPAEDATTHGIQGINDGADFLLEREEVDLIEEVKTQDAIDRARQLASELGLLVGISAGANVLAAEKYVRERDPDGIVVTMLCDRGERYMSIY